MKKVRLLFGLTSAVIMSAAVGAWAAIVPVTENIAASQTWTADNVYRLDKQIFVLPGATLARTVCAPHGLRMGRRAPSRR